MSLPSILEIRLEENLSPIQLQNTFNDIALLGGLSGMDTHSSIDNVFYCSIDGGEEVAERIKNISNVLAVNYLPLPWQR